MNTAAHETRRAGPRRVDLPSGSKVTPRRNAPDAGEPGRLQYDSDELPVLIRLPNLRDLGSIETPPAPKTRHHRVDPASAAKNKTAQQSTSKVTKQSIHERAGGSRVVLGGIAGGILVIVLLVLFNSFNSSPPDDDDAWAREAAELQVPEIELPDEIAAPLDFAYEAPNADTAPYASSERVYDSAGVPDLQAQQMPGEPATALPYTKQPIVGWPSDEALGVQAASGSEQVDLWPGESLGPTQNRYQYAPENAPVPTDGYQSGALPIDTESYRMGKLNSDRPSAAAGDQGSILDGNIEIPDTKSLR